MQTRQPNNSILINVLEWHMEKFFRSRVSGMKMKLHWVAASTYLSFISMHKLCVNILMSLGFDDALKLQQKSSSSIRIIVVVWQVGSLSHEHIQHTREWRGPKCERLHRAKWVGVLCYNIGKNMQNVRYRCCSCCYSYS